MHRLNHRETCLCYDQTITPINGQDKWATTNDEPILLPVIKQGIEGLKKLKRREPNGEPNLT